MGKIIKGHSFDEYQKKYGKKFNDGKLQFVKLTDKDKLNAKKNYWEIKDKEPGFYEINNRPWLIPVIILGSVAVLTAAIVPAVLLTRPQPTPPPGPVVEYCDFKFTGTDCKIKVGEEYKQEHTFSLEKGKKPTETYNIKADDECKLPDVLEAPSIITYEKKDERNATISFNDKINENTTLQITATPVTQTVDLTVTGSGCKVVVGGKSETSHTFTYDKGSKPAESISLEADSGYSFPATQSGLPNFLEYTKTDDSNATLSFIDNINNTTSVTITAEQPTSDYSFTFTGTNCTLDNESSYPADTNVDLTLTPTNATYDVPEHIAVKIDDIIQTEDVDYTYTPGDTSASLSLKVTGDVEVEALAREKNLVLTLTVKPEETKNHLGFVFQCTPETPEHPDPEVDKIVVDWGDEAPLETISAPENIDKDIVRGGPTATDKGMFGYVYYMMGHGGARPGPLSDELEFNRHQYNPEFFGQELTVKIYGNINNIAFGFPYPNDGTTILPWGTANENITSVTTYCDLPAAHINSSKEYGYDFDTYVVFSSEEEMTSIDFALGTTKIPNGCCCKAGKLTGVNIPETVTEIGSEAFCEAGLTKIFIPDSVTKIGYDAFKCNMGSPEQLEDGITFGENSKLEEIGVGAFMKCKFKTFDLPKSVATIYGTDAEEKPSYPYGAFYGCEQIGYIVIDHVLSIGKGTFSNWKSSQKIYFPYCADEDDIKTKYGDPADWKGEATLVPGEYPSAI